MKGKLTTMLFMSLSYLCCHFSCRIKGAVHLNLDIVRDTESDWPNTIPSREHFEKCIGDVSALLYNASSSLSNHTRFTQGLRSSFVSDRLI